MKNKIENKIIKTIDFKGFNLFLTAFIQKINEVIKDKKRKMKLSQQPVGQFTQQAVAQLKCILFLTFLRSQIATLNLIVLSKFQIHRDAERQLNTEG
jgi:hypothetical protein